MAYSQFALVCYTYLCNVRILLDAVSHLHDSTWHRTYLARSKPVLFIDLFIYQFIHSLISVCNDRALGALDSRLQRLLPLHWSHLRPSLLALFALTPTLFSTLSPLALSVWQCNTIIMQLKKINKYTHAYLYNHVQVLSIFCFVVIGKNYVLCKSDEKVLWVAYIFSPNYMPFIMLLVAECFKSLNER